VGVDVEVLVDEVEAILLAVVAEDVLLLVRVSKLHDFASNEVADAAPDTDKGEAVSGDPEA